MSTTVRDVGPFEKLVSFSIPETEIEAAKAHTVRRLSREVNIRGFRPGKAPRPLVEAAVGASRLRSEAIDDLLPDRIGQMLGEMELVPAVAPELEKLDNTLTGIDIEVRVTLWPELDDIPVHEGRSITVGSPEVTEEEIDAQIDRIRLQFAELDTVDRPIADGDFAAIDISAQNEGLPVPDATAEQLLYEVGSGRFIDGIDVHLIGAAGGDTVTFDGQLPPGFGEGASQTVTFTIKVTEVRQRRLPELVDSWVEEISEFASVEELRVNLEEQMEATKRRSAAVEFRQRALDELVDQILIELPDRLIRVEMEELLHRFGHRLSTQNVSFDDYFRVTGITQAQFTDDLRLQADRSLRTRLLLEGVARRHRIEVTPEELAGVIESVAARSERPEQARAALAGGPQRMSLMGDILRDKAFNAIIAGAAPVDQNGQPVELFVDDAPELEAENPMLEGEIFEGEILEGEMVEGEIFEAEVVEAKER